MKTALVTGGSRGIGMAIALELGRSGYAVAIMATKPESAYPQSTQKLREAGVSYSWHAGDIANTEDRLRVVDEVAARHGRIDVLVNNAGVAPGSAAFAPNDGRALITSWAPTQRATCL